MLKKIKIKLKLKLKLILTFSSVSPVHAGCPGKANTLYTTPQVVFTLILNKPRIQLTIEVFNQFHKAVLANAYLITDDGKATKSFYDAPLSDSNEPPNNRSPTQTKVRLSIETVRLPAEQLQFTGVESIETKSIKQKM